MLAPTLKAGCCKGIDSREEKKKKKKSRTPLCQDKQAAFYYLRIFNL